jgi:hypothetical protein
MQAVPEKRSDGRHARRGNLRVPLRYLIIEQVVVAANPILELWVRLLGIRHTLRRQNTASRSTTGASSICGMPKILGFRFRKRRYLSCFNVLMKGYVKFEVDLVFPIRDEASAALMSVKAECLYRARLISEAERLMVMQTAAKFASPSAFSTASPMAGATTRF